MKYLDQNTSIIINDPDSKRFKGVIRVPHLNGEHAGIIYARSLPDSDAFANYEGTGTPILLYDNGALSKDFEQRGPEMVTFLNTWQIMITSKFDVMLDFEKPANLNDKYDWDIKSKHLNLIGYTSYDNIEQRLCSIIAFIMTAHGACQYFFDQNRLSRKKR